MNSQVDQESGARSLEKAARSGYKPLHLFRGSLDDLLHPPPNQVPFLHGLRAIAILLVVNHHFSAAFTAIHGVNRYSEMPFVLNGWSGVDLFFVLSGFFIGSQLWREVASKGTLSISRFIVRRGLRIWPLFYFIYLVTLLLDFHGAAAKQYGWGDLVFLANYFNTGIVGGGWSLCSEEQFYILAPLLIYFVGKKAHLPRVRLYMWLIMAALPLERFLFWEFRTGSFLAHDPAAFAAMYYKFNTHCDGLVMGVLVAHLWNFGERAAMSLRRSAVLVVAAFVALIGLRALQHEIFIFSGLALFFGSLVWIGLTPGVRLFRSRVFYWISRLSFGMYLNHGFLIHPVLTKALFRWTPFPVPSVFAQLSGTIILVVLSAFVSLVTFSVIEQPFLNLRAHLLQRR